MKFITRAVGLLLLLLFWAFGAVGQTRDWQQAEGYRWAALPARQPHASGFTLLLPDQTGLTFTNTVDEWAGASNRTLINGAGLATGDFDQDGLTDVYFGSLSGQSKLFRNRGLLQFEDVTQSAGVALPGVIARGAVFADINGDGALDLLLSTLGRGVICFLNDGHGHFTNVTVTAGTGSNYGSATTALADVDGNGTLDLYIANYRSEDIRDRGQVDLSMVKGQMVVPPKLKDRFLVVSGGHVLEYGEPDQLLLNDGQGHFTPVSWTAGAFLDEDEKPLQTPPLDWGLTAAFRDLNGDGAPDLYVCNDYWTPDRIWINDGHGHFRALPRLALRETSSSSMGVDFADVDLDGHVDFIVTDMLSRNPRLRKRQMPARWPVPEPIQSMEFRPQVIQNTLFRNRGDGTFAEMANYSGVAATEWTWQPLFLDADLDGYPDLFVSAGHAHDVQDLDAEAQIKARQHSWKGFTNAIQRQQIFTRELMEHMRFYPRLDMPLFAFRNRGDCQFEETSAAWGTGALGVHHAMALGDFDNDGDLDLVVNNLGSAAGFYRNDVSAGRVAVRLKGRAPNTEGIGAQVTLKGGAVPGQRQEVVCGGRYMSGSDPLLVLGTGAHTAHMTLDVRWRDGKTSQVLQVQANRIYEIDEPKGPPPSAAQNAHPAAPSGSPMLFEDRTRQLNHAHKDEPFDDRQRQPLLPKKLSQLGPGVAWFDLNGDGWEDLIIGSGRGGRLQVFLNDQRGGFKPASQPPFDLPVTRDQTGILGMTWGDGQQRVLAGSSNYEDGLAAGASVRQSDWSGKRIDDSIPGQLSSTGPLALADIDGDGRLELFVGGRYVPGRYPEAASSVLLRQVGDHWEIDHENTRALRNAGLVASALWSDLDDDGFPELILACEWGPVKVFANARGRLQVATAQWGLDKVSGWWGGLAAADLNEDGKLDLIVGNWGLNSLYSASPERPLRLYYGDLAGRGGVDLVEAEYDPVTKQDAPRRRLDALAPVFPFISGQFATHRAYSEAIIPNLFSANLSNLKLVQANTLASLVLLNRGTRFDPVPLPREAQLAPVFAVQVADFDGDGHEDVFLSQNFFGTLAEVPRQDSGRGLLLLGDGVGGLIPMAGDKSGIRIYGQQRGAAVADFDQDGRTDLVVAQNNAPTQLLRNAGAKPGLRVRLIGTAGNSSAIGASMRLFFRERGGPVREIHAGSGYWSQDSSVQVLSTPQPPSQLWVRWPGGKTTTTPIPGSLTEITLDSTGNVTASR